MKLTLFQSIAVVSALLMTTIAYAQPASTPTDRNTKTAQSVATSEVNTAIDSYLRKVLTDVGIKTQIIDIKSSNLPSMYQVNLVEQPPLHITADGKYVIQGELQENPSPRKARQTPARATSAQAGEYVSAEVKASLLANMSALKNTSAKTSFFYTAVPGVIWGATLEGVPFLISDDGKYISRGEISIIADKQFLGLDADFEKAKNKSVLATLEDAQLITYPATRNEKAVIYVATDVNCLYCRQLHKQMNSLNAKGVTIKNIGYPIYEQSPKQMRAIWCQADESRRRNAFNNAMLQSQMTSASASCNTDYITSNRDIAAALAVIATPAIYRDDGVLYQGSFESPEFLEFLGVEQLFPQP